MCVFCKSKDFKSSFTTHVVNYDDCIIIIKNVPCEECEQCGEIFFTDEVAARLEQIVDSVKKAVNNVSIIDYFAA